MAELRLVSSNFQVPRRSTDAQDTVRCLRALLAEAEAGRITGLSYAAITSNRELFYSSFGEAHRDVGKAAALASMLMHGTMRRMFGEDT
jgi:hypothetical protein